MDDAIDQMNQIASGREAHQNQRSSFVELRRGFAASRQGDARGWDWETGDQNSGDFIDLQGHEQNAGRGCCCDYQGLGSPGMELSTGGSVGGDAWRLSADDLHYAWIAPPEGFVGSADLIAELRLSTDQIADR